MKKLLNCGLLAGLIVSSAASAGGAHWGYIGNTGPQHWAELDNAYALCGSGKNQSPVNLSGFTEADLGTLDVSYTHAARNIINNGHTVQANFDGGDTLTVDGHAYTLKQFHFHTPSENHIDGKSFPLEAHLVHADEDGNLAVVSVLFQEGDSNGALTKLWKQMPGKEGAESTLNAQVGAADILPAKGDYYRFNGSLTTPPCSEGVLWVVMKEPVTVSKQQVSAIAKVLTHPNNRPVQRLNARTVLK